MIGIVNWLRAPRKNIRLSFIFLLLWLVLGMLDQTVFNSTAVESKRVVFSLFGIEFKTYFAQGEPKVLTWIEDLVGHWFALFGLLAAIALDRSIRVLEKQSKRITDFAKQSVDQKFVLLLIGLAFLMIIAVYQNYTYVMENEAVHHWTREIATILPLVVASLFYLMVLFPICCSLFFYIKLLQLISQKIEMVEGFHILHKDGMFGLRPLGRTILWAVVIFAIFTFPVLGIQFFQKEDISQGNFLGAIVVLYLFWMVCIKPITIIYDQLSLVKDKSYTTIARILGKARKDKQEAAEIARLEQYETLVSNLHTIPLKPGELLLSALIIIGLFIKIILGAVSMLH